VRLGIDIGGTKAALAIGDDTGIFASDVYEHWSKGAWRPAVDALLKRAEQLIQGSAHADTPLESVGISSPGPLDIPAGRIVAAHNIPGWTDVPIAEVVADHFGCKAVLENDANAAALAEWRYGAGQGSRVMLFLTMSSGVGGGIVIDGQLHAGSSFQAGEVGHMPIELDGRTCSCGQRGCLEAYTGGMAIAEMLRERIAAGAESKLTLLAGGQVEQIDARLWVSAIRAGDTLALELREQFLSRLTQGLACLIPTLDPDCIVLGTLIQRNPELFLEELRTRVREHVWTAYHALRIEAGALGEKLPFYAGLAASLRTAPQASGSR